MENQLLILLSEEGAEAEHVAELTGHLREDLLDLDVDDVTAVPGEEAPPGARVVDVALIGGLLVALGKSATGLGQVVTVLRSWLGRFHDGRPSLRLQIDDDVLEVSEATDEQVEVAFRMFVERHSTAGAQP